MIRLFQMLLLTASIVGFAGAPEEEGNRLRWMSGMCCRRRSIETIPNTRISQSAIDTPLLPKSFVWDTNGMAPDKKKTVGVMIVKANQEECILVKICGVYRKGKFPIFSTESIGPDDVHEVMNRINLFELRCIVSKIGNERLERIRRDVQRQRNDEDKIKLIEKDIRDLPQNSIPEVLIPFCARILLEYSGRPLPFRLNDFSRCFFRNLFF